jgi:hypothetical protein
MVEDTFRSAKSILETRPIFHKCEETIRGHVFCSFLALVLKRELEIRMEQKGLAAQWAEVIRGLDNLQQVELPLQVSRFLLLPARSICTFQAEPPSENINVSIHFTMLGHSFVTA